MILETWVLVGLVGAVLAPPVMAGMAIGKGVEAVLPPPPGQVTTIQVEGPDGRQYAVDVSDYVDGNGSVSIQFQIGTDQSGATVVMTAAEIELLGLSTAAKQFPALAPSQQIEVSAALVAAAEKRCDEIRRTPRRQVRPL